MTKLSDCFIFANGINHHLRMLISNHKFLFTKKPEANAPGFSFKNILN